jgi:hypothetical protein
MVSDKTKNDAIDTLKVADEFILIAWTGNGLKIQSSINERAFTMLGGIELAKMSLLNGFKDKAEKYLVDKEKGEGE